MICAAINTGSTERLIEIRESIDFIKSIIPAPPGAVPRHINNLKGQIFVQLYGVIEFTIVELLKTSLNFINSLSLNIADVKHSILSLILDPELESLKLVSSKKWEKRFDLTEKLRSNAICLISNSIMPTDGRNFGVNQFRSIWNVFSISDPIFHDVAFQGRLSEIIGHRNKIAHGEYTASSIGSAQTVGDLYSRQTEVSRFCSYLISVFENYLTSAAFKI